MDALALTTDGLLSDALAIATDGLIESSSADIVGSGDAEPPFFTWDAFTTLRYDQPFQVNAWDNLNDLLTFMVLAEYPAQGLLEVVYDGAIFGPKYRGSNNWSGDVAGEGELAGLIADGVKFLRDGGWPDTQIIVHLIAFDNANNRADELVTVPTVQVPSTDVNTTTTSTTVAINADTVADTNNPRDLLVDVTTGDIAFDGGDLQLVSDTDSIAQAVRLRLAFFLGEWFLDEEIGVPYFQRIFIKNPNFVEIREWVRRALLDTPGVNEIQTIDVKYNGNRVLTVSFRVSTDVGELTQTVEVNV